jgi:hypothetical protein
MFMLFNRWWRLVEDNEVDDRDEDATEDEEGTDEDGSKVEDVCFDFDTDAFILDEATGTDELGDPGLVPRRFVSLSSYSIEDDLVPSFDCVRVLPVAGTPSVLGTARLTST